MARILYVIPNPDGSDPVSPAFNQIVVQRAPDAGGTPGAFTTIATITPDPNNEDTDYLDDAGTLSSWYRHYYTNGSVNSDNSTSVQAGDYVVRQWIKADIPDTDVTSTDWDRWRDQTLQDINQAGLGRPADIVSITPSSYTDEWHDLVAQIRRVIRVEKYDSGGNFVTVTNQWHQYGRKIRLVTPNTKLTYKVYGVAEIRGLNDIDDELFNVLYWGMRWRYCNFRTNKRQDTRSALGRTKQTDYPALRDFQALAKEAKAQFDAALVSAMNDQQLTYSGGS